MRRARIGPADIRRTGAVKRVLFCTPMLFVKSSEDKKFNSLCCVDMAWALCLKAGSAFF